MDPEARIRELARQLLERSRQDTRTMREAAAHGDLASIASLAHRMAGAAGAFGYADLDAGARRLQRAAEAQDTAGLPALLAAVESELERLA